MQPESRLAEVPGRSPARRFGRWLIWLASLTIPFAIAAILEGRDLMRAGPAPQTPGSQAEPASRAA